MTRHQKLDAILKYMSEHLDDIPQRPDTIIKKASLDFEKSESYSMLKLMSDDGYIYSHNEKASYGIKYKGIIFLDNGGYTLQHRIYKRKMFVEKISDYVNILVKPIGIITAILVAILTIIKILEFFRIIEPI